MKAGFARSVITPPLPVQLAGHRGPRIANEIGDDLFARAVVFSHRDVLAAIVSNDLIWLPRRVVGLIRDRISRTTAIRPENVIIACTHTHSGPDTLDWYAFAPPVADWWIEWLVNMIASTVHVAAQRMADCHSSLGVSSFPFAVNRRKPIEGIVYREPNPEGPTDERLTVLGFSDGERMLGAIVHAGMHPVVLGGDSAVISGDWCGAMTSALERKFGGVWLFLNGAAGDNNPKLWSGNNSYAVMSELGARAAEHASEAFENAAPFEVGALGGRTQSDFYDQKPHPYLSAEQNRRATTDGGLLVESQTLLLGALRLVAVGGECLFSTAQLIEAEIGKCLVVSYANDYVGYVPRADHYREGGYEPAASMLSMDGAEAYIATAVANARSLAGAR